MNRRIFGTCLIVLALVALVAVPASAVDPIPGTYTSVEYGSGSQDVLTGRGSNSRPVPDLGFDNIFNSMSWDGAVLGTQWVFRCGVSVFQSQNDLRNANGDGVVIIQTLYNGGGFWFSKDGPWGDSVNHLTGTTNSLLRITTLQFLDWVPVRATENVNTAGEFDESNCVLEFVINNNVGVGDTDQVPFPADYPGLLDLACRPGSRTSGSWGDVRDIVMSISCALPTQKASWGHVKSLYQ